MITHRNQLFYANNAENHANNAKSCDLLQFENEAGVLANKNTGLQCKINSASYDMVECKI